MAIELPAAFDRDRRLQSRDAPRHRRRDLRLRRWPRRCGRWDMRVGRGVRHPGRSRPGDPRDLVLRGDRPRAADATERQVAAPGDRSLGADQGTAGLSRSTTAGSIERRGFVDRLPQFDRLYSAALLFERAERHFRRTSRFLDDRGRRSAGDHALDLSGAGPAGGRAQHLHAARSGAAEAAVRHARPEAGLSPDGRALRRATPTISSPCPRSSRNDVIDDVRRSRATGSPTPISTRRCPRPRWSRRARMSPASSAWSPGGYFLYFGAIEPKKNVARLIEAYLSIEHATPLVIVGARAWQKDEELRLMDAVGRSRRRAGAKRIIQLDYLPRRLLMQLVAHGARGAVPVALRRVRPAGARGDAAGHARGHQHHGVAARGRRRRGAAGRSV